MPIKIADLSDLTAAYGDIKPDIKSRLDDFTLIGKCGSEEDLFRELVFCILTPQSQAFRCWDAVCSLHENGLLLHGGFEEIRNHLRKVRFMNNKARYILHARKIFIEKHLSIRKILMSHKTDAERREWLVRHIYGFGLKESSHFLRNIGLGRNLAILDRHILKNLKMYGVIDEIPSSISKKKYFEMEEAYISFSEQIAIPPHHLDLLLWYRETGKLFK